MALIVARDQRFKRSEDRGGTAHVALHATHRGGGLEGETTTVVNDTLAHCR